MPRHAVPKLHDILDERVLADSLTLVHLIWEHNPTGRDLSRAEQTRLYQIKSRLQSQLIRRFFAELRFRRDPRHQAIVAIEHSSRTGWRSAGHARLDALDPDASDQVQAWLDQQADLEPQSVVVRPAPQPPREGRRGRQERPARSAAEDLPLDHAGEAETDEIAARLRAGAAAAAAYDYEEAQAQLQAAFLASGGALAPARALLELLVDGLGLNDVAGALAPRLSAEARSNVEVRRLLATAAARREDVDAAWALCAELPQPQAAPILVLLARAALRSQDLPRAAALVGALLPIDPRPPELPLLQHDLAQLRATARAPREAAAQALLAAGQEAQAEAAAQALLGDHPESRVASRVLREIAERRAARLAQDLLAQAEGAGVDRRALLLYQQALSTLLPGATAHDELRRLIDRRLLEVEEQLQRAEDEAAVAQVAPLLGDPRQRPAGLLRYVGLLPRQREQVRALQQGPELDWLEQLSVGRGRPLGQKHVDSVLALRRAHQALEDARSQPQAELDLLCLHEQVVSRLSDGKAVLQRLAQRVEQHAQAQALQTLQETLAELEQSRLTPEQIQRRVRELNPRALPASALPLYRYLTEESLKVRELVRLHAEIARLVAAADYVAARAATLRFLDGADATNQAQFARDLEMIEQRIDAQYRARRVGRAGPAHELFDVDWPLHAGRGVQQWVLPGGREAVVPTDAGIALGLRIIDLQGGRVQRQVLLQLQKSFGLHRVQVTSVGIWALGAGAALLVDPERLLVTQRIDLSKLVPEGRELVFAVMSPDGQTLWLGLTRPPQIGEMASTELAEVYTVDVDGSRRPRSVGQCVLPRPVRWHGETLLLSGRPPRELILMAERGGVVRRFELDQQMELCAAVSDPSGAEPLALCSDRPMVRAWSEPSRGSLPGLFAVRLSAHGRAVGPRQELPGLVVDPHLGAVALSAPAGGRRLIVVTRCAFPGPDGEPVYGRGLTWLTEEAGAPLHVDRSQRLEPGSVVVTDPLGGDAALLRMTEAGLCVTRLEDWVKDAPPRWAGVSTELWRDGVPRPCNLDVCSVGLLLMGGQGRVLRELTELQHSLMASQDMTPRLEQLIRDPEVAVDLAMNQSLPMAQPVQVLMAQVVKDHPRHPRVLMYQAHRAVGRDWAAIEPALDQVDLGQLPEQWRKHWHHLRALARMYHGDPAGAQAEIERGRPLRGSCPLPMLERVLDRPGPGWQPTAGEAAPAMWRLRWLLEQADVLLSRDEARLAQQLLDQPVVLASQDLQLLARLVMAWLSIEDLDEVQRLRRDIALAQFMRQAQHRIQSAGLLFPGRMELPQLDVLALLAFGMLLPRLDIHRALRAMVEDVIRANGTAQIVSPGAAFMTAATDIARSPEASSATADNPSAAAEIARLLRLVKPYLLDSAARPTVLARMGAEPGA